ncbi:MAG: N-acetyltransferase [Rhodoferax sp.]|nr:N-acetyltransferase [Rhodoferax sp.]
MPRLTEAVLPTSDYVIRVVQSPRAVNAQAWDALLTAQPHATPFMQHAYLAALHESGSAVANTGWAPHFFLLEHRGELQAACVVYAKDHSYGEYIFDWAWARAYQQHGVPYYPKAVMAVPFTPVPGARMLARDADARRALLEHVLAWCGESGMSSLHALFAAEADMDALKSRDLMPRQTVQFHWQNRVSAPYADFEDFLSTLSQDKRKKIRQERRKVNEAGVEFRWAHGADIPTTDWDFFYRCYERTYLEHGNLPYLNRDFFARMQTTMPQNWLMFTAERNGKPIATSLIAIHADSAGTRVAYGRYWGALERVDCLHFEACYYQPLQWCIAQGYQRFEGGAQGEHKMARALMPVVTHSAHWLAHPDFADAVARFLERETVGMEDYVRELQAHGPFRTPPPSPTPHC